VLATYDVDLIRNNNNILLNDNMKPCSCTVLLQFIYLVLLLKCCENTIGIFIDYCDNVSAAFGFNSPNVILAFLLSYFLL